LGCAAQDSHGNIPEGNIPEGNIPKGNIRRGNIRRAVFAGETEAIHWPKKLAA